MYSNYLLSDYIIAKILNLDVQRRNLFRLYYQNEEKETVIAWILFIFLGALYGYLGSWRKQILFWITFGGFGIWALILCFQVKSKVIEYNDRQALNCLSNLDNKYLAIFGNLPGND